MEKFTHAHALMGIYLTMSAIDGEIADNEVETVLKKAVPLLTPALGAEATKQTWDETIDWFFKFDNQKDRIGAILNSAAGIANTFEKPLLIQICKDLASIAQADGKIHDMEKKFFAAILEIMEISPNDLG